MNTNTNLAHLRKIVESLEQLGIEETAAITIEENEGVPTIVKVQEGPVIEYYVESVDGAPGNLVKQFAISLI